MLRRLLELQPNLAFKQSQLREATVLTKGHPHGRSTRRLVRILYRPTLTRPGDEVNTSKKVTKEVAIVDGKKGSSFEVRLLQRRRCILEGWNGKHELLRREILCH